MVSKTFRLRDLEIPQIGFGTQGLRGILCTRCVSFALSYGYKHIDTSATFKNEHMIGMSLARTDRSSLFITTKIPYFANGYRGAINSVERSLELLKTDYLDLCLLDIPWNEASANDKNIEARINSWRALEDLKEQKKIRHIGVSNFKVSHLEYFCKLITIKPEANQVEIHPLCFDSLLYNYCKDKQIQLIAHTPLGNKSPELWDNFDIKMIAIKHKASFASILLCWALNKGIAVIPKSQNYENIKNNSLAEIQLDEDDIELLDSINKNMHFARDAYQFK